MKCNLFSDYKSIIQHTQLKQRPGMYLCRPLAQKVSDFWYLGSGCTRMFNLSDLCSVNPQAYGSRKGTIQKYFANPKKFFKSQCFSKITVEEFVKSKELLQILRTLLDPQITLLTIRKYFANP